MNFTHQSIFYSGFQDSFGIFNGKETRITKYINVIGQLFFSHAGQHFVNDNVNIFFLFPTVFQRNGMGT